MLKSKRFIGMPVISLAEGQQLGKVKELVVDPLKKSVVALLIEQKGWFKEEKFIPYSKVRSVGNDAITIEQSNLVQKGTSLPEIVKLINDKHSIIGSKVVAENGTVLGITEEFYVNVEDGTLAGLEISGSFINSIISGRAFLDSSFIRTIGRNLMVTGNEASDNLVKIDGGLKETIKTIKDGSSNLWEGTVVKAKEVTGSINKKLEELKEKKKKEEQHSECECCQQEKQDSSPISENSQNSTADDEKNGSTKQPANKDEQSQQEHAHNADNLEEKNNTKPPGEQ